MKSLYSSTLLISLLTLQACGRSPKHSESQVTNATSGPNDCSNETLQALRTALGTANCDAPLFEALKTVDSIDIMFKAVPTLNELKNLSRLKKLWVTTNGVSAFSLEGSDNIEDLMILGGNFADLSGIQNLKNLKSLAVSSGALKDLSTVRGEGLEFLSVQSPVLESLTALKNTKIKTLRIESDALTSFDYAGFVDSLTSLSLIGTKVSDISQLSRFTNLEDLHISGASISSFAALQSLTKLKSLTISNCSLTSASDFASLSNLNTLQIVSCPVNDVSGLSALPNLKHLALSYTKITGTGFLTSLPKLASLNLSGNPGLDIAGVESQTELQELSLEGSAKVSDNVLGKMEKLQALNLASTGFTNLGKISSLKNLESLNIARNSINEAFFEAPSLKYLTIDANPIGGNISGIHTPSLEVLNATSTGLNDSSLFSGFKTVTHMNISNNAISDLRSVILAQNLEYLNLENNRVSNYGPIINGNGAAENSGPLAWLQELKLAGNPSTKPESPIPSNGAIGLIKKEAQLLSSRVKIAVDSFGAVATRRDINQEVVSQFACIRLDNFYQTFDSYARVLEKIKPAVKLEDQFQELCSDPTANCQLDEIVQQKSRTECPSLDVGLDSRLGEIVSLAQKTPVPRAVPLMFLEHLSDKDMAEINRVLDRRDELAKIEQHLRIGGTLDAELRKKMLNSMSAVEVEGKDFVQRVEKLKLAIRLSVNAQHADLVAELKRFEAMAKDK